MQTSGIAPDAYGLPISTPLLHPTSIDPLRYDLCRQPCFVPGARLGPTQMLPVIEGSRADRNARFFQYLVVETRHLDPSSFPHSTKVIFEVVEIIDEFERYYASQVGAYYRNHVHLTKAALLASPWHRHLSLSTLVLLITNLLDQQYITFEQEIGRDYPEIELWRASECRDVGFKHFSALLAVLVFMNAGRWTGSEDHDYVLSCCVRLEAMMWHLAVLREWQSDFHNFRLQQISDHGTR